MAVIQSKDTQFLIGKNNIVEFEDKDIADNKTRSEQNELDISALKIRVDNVEALLSTGGIGAGGSGNCKVASEVITVPSEGRMDVQFSDPLFDYDNAMYILYAYDADADSVTQGGYVNGDTVGTYKIYSNKISVYNNYNIPVQFKIVGIYGVTS